MMMLPLSLKNPDLGGSNPEPSPDSKCGCICLCVFLLLFPATLLGAEGGNTHCLNRVFLHISYICITALPRRADKPMKASEADASSEDHIRAQIDDYGLSDAENFLLTRKKKGPEKYVPSLP